VICLGCRKTIDPLYDSTASDERGRPWHTSCWVEHVGAHDTVAMADGERAMQGSLLGWVLGRWDRRKVRRPR
jgi:hypothetical protein